MTNSTSSSSAPARRASGRRRALAGGGLRCLSCWRRASGRAGAPGRRRSPMASPSISAAAGCIRPTATRSSPSPRRRAARSTNRRRRGAARARRSARSAAHGRLRRGHRARFATASTPGRQTRPTSPAMRCSTPASRFNPLIDAVSTYYSGAELAKVSAARPRAPTRIPASTGACARATARSIAGLAEGLPIALSTARSAPSTGSGARLARRDGRGRAAARRAVDRHAAERRAGADAGPVPPRAAGENRGRGGPAARPRRQALSCELLEPQTISPPIPARFGAWIGARPAPITSARSAGRSIEAYFGGELAEALERGGEAARLGFRAART